MARGRMLNRKVATDDKVARYGDEFGVEGVVFHHRLIAFLDVNGNVRADPYWLKAEVMPRVSGVTPEDCRRLAAGLVKHGLAELYEAEGMPHLHFPRFRDNQVGLRTDRESAEYPTPQGFDEDTGTLPEDFRKPSGYAPAEVEVEVEGEVEGGEGSLPDGRSPSPGEPGEEDSTSEDEGPAYPTSPDQLRAWVAETPKPDSREEFASQHMALGVWALWKGREPPEKKPGPAYDIGAELRKLRQRHGPATNRELALFVAGVCLRRDEGEYGSVEPGEGMTLGFVDALNENQNGRSEWSRAKQRARELLEGEGEDAVDRVLAGLEPV